MNESQKRNLFEVENARNLSPNEVINTFVPTKSFWRLLSPKNHIVLGARGSGKTALVKMLAHDHLSQFDNRQARQIIDKKELIGMYVPTRLEWVGGLKNKQWKTEGEAELFFQWRLNISSCAALLVALRSCFDIYIEDIGQRAKLERELSIRLSATWTFDEGSYDTFEKLQQFLEDTEHDKQAEITRARVRGDEQLISKVGIYFECELFTPLRRAIKLAGRALELPKNSMWMLCLDEAEFLEPYHHRILNSHLRAHPENLVLKITTMPYSHYTLATNTGASLNVGHDFEYVYIDKDPVFLAGGEDSGEEFAKNLFVKRASQSSTNYKWDGFEQLLGISNLLDAKASNWTEASKMMNLLNRYANKATINRANRLAGTPAFKDQISRKIHGALLLREAIDLSKGNKALDIYSGLKMAIRCSDSNPRRLIRIFNTLINEATEKPDQTGLRVITKSRQTRALITFSTSTLNRVQSEPLLGPALHAFLMKIGNYMKHDFYEHQLGTDQTSSIEIDGCSDHEWEIIKTAVGLGLLFPNVNVNSADQMPERSGIFRLAYVLSPMFRLLPRKGKSISLQRLYSEEQGFIKKERNQLSFFEAHDKYET